MIIDAEVFGAEVVEEGGGGAVEGDVVCLYQISIRINYSRKGSYKD